MHNHELPIETDCHAVKKMLAAGEDFLLLDCREPGEYAAVHLDGAKLLPMNDLQTRLDELLPFQDRQVVVHCHHGGRSLRVANWLRKQGFTHAQSMAGGIDAWAAEIDPTLPRY